MEKSFKKVIHLIGVSLVGLSLGYIACEMVGINAVKDIEQGMAIMIGGLVGLGIIWSSCLDD